MKKNIFLSWVRGNKKLFKVGLTSGVLKDNFNSVNDVNWLDFSIEIDVAKNFMATVFTNTFQTLPDNTRHSVWCSLKFYQTK